MQGASAEEVQAVRNANDGGRTACELVGGRGRFGERTGPCRQSRAMAVSTARAWAATRRVRGNAEGDSRV